MKNPEVKNKQQVETVVAEKLEVKVSSLTVETIKELQAKLNELQNQLNLIIRTALAQDNVDIKDVANLEFSEDATKLIVTKK